MAHQKTITKQKQLIFWLLSEDIKILDIFLQNTKLLMKGMASIIKTHLRNPEALGPSLASFVRYIGEINKFLSGNLLRSRKDYQFFPKNSALNLGTYFFSSSQRYLYLPYKLRGTLKKKFIGFFFVFLKIWLWKEAKIS